MNENWKTYNQNTIEKITVNIDSEYRIESIVIYSLEGSSQQYDLNQNFLFFFPLNSKFSYIFYKN